MNVEVDQIDITLGEDGRSVAYRLLAIDGRQFTSSLTLPMAISMASFAAREWLALATTGKLIWREIVEPKDAT